jgi:glucose/arabinose dehydrogenase
MHFLKRMILLGCLGIGLIAVVSAEPTRRDRPPSGDAIKVIELASGIERPILVTNAGDGTNRLFIVQQIGIIRVFENGVLLEEPFLDLTDRVSKIEGFAEQGLFGLAFHPDYENNGKFYVHYSHQENPWASIVEFKVSADDPNKADISTARVVMEISQQGTDHYGGALVFGPDGYLYIGKGDGSGPEDADRASQNTNVFNGKLLRISVDKEGAAYGLIRDNPFVGTGKGANEIFAYGLRNPYTFSFDSETGDIYIADVGENTLEELNFIPAGFKGAPNFGWSALQGADEVFNEDQEVKSDMIAPIVEYAHNEDRCAIIGGHVYRGEALPDLVGAYVYADWCSGVVYYLYQDSSDQWQTGRLLELNKNITGIGLDENREMYMVYYGLDTMTGGLLKLEPANE